MEASMLLNALREADRRTDEEWLSSLSSRKVEELKFHDAHRNHGGEAELSAGEYEERYGNRKFYATSALSQQYFENWIRNHSPGNVVLDYACGDGNYALRAARAGANLAIGLDISRVSVENARDTARREGLESNTFFVQGDCENTGLPSSSVDVVICCGMLHHLDLSYAFPELRRILKPGGKIVALEALDYNPVIKLYRNMTPAMRTEWESEHILSLDDLRFARHFFELEEIRYWHLFSLFATPLRNTPLFRPALRFGNALDSVLLRVPPISLMAWTFTFVLAKREEK